MDDPIKIIHKYKNNNSRIQYHIHIFLGDIVDENCMRILRKIKDMDLYTSLISLDDRERDIIVKNYGDFWYEKFFNSYHINNSKETTIKNPAKMKELRSVYDTKWVNEHFVNYTKRIETISYNYEYMIKEERERKMIKKIMQKQQHEAEDIIDYTTFGKNKTITSTPDLSVGLNSNSNYQTENSNIPFEVESRIQPHYNSNNKQDSES